MTFTRSQPTGTSFQLKTTVFYVEHPNFWLKAGKGFIKIKMKINIQKSESPSLYDTSCIAV